MLIEKDYLSVIRGNKGLHFCITELGIRPKIVQIIFDLRPNLWYQIKLVDYLKFRIIYKIRPNASCHLENLCKLGLILKFGLILKDCLLYKVTECAGVSDDCNQPCILTHCGQSVVAYTMEAIGNKHLFVHVKYHCLIPHTKMWLVDHIDLCFHGLCGWSVYLLM